MISMFVSGVTRLMGVTVAISMASFPIQSFLDSMLAFSFLLCVNAVLDCQC